MALWCVTGIVMIYAPYPRIDADARLRSLAVLDWPRVARLARQVAGGNQQYARFQLEMLSGSPVLRLWRVDSSMQLLQLNASAGASGIDEPQAVDAAVRYAKYLGRPVRAAVTELIPYDQWTVAGSRRDRPLYRIDIGDDSGTEIYVSSRSGMVVQATTRAQRFWGWLGAVPHWLYLSSLRSRPVLWSQVVIWTSLLGVLLASTGLIIGICALAQSAKQVRYSPYQGVMLWHHLAGLAFGVLVLSWVLSGFFSMNPWGLMEGGEVQDARARLAGPLPAGAGIAAVLEALATASPAEIRALESAPLNGELFVVATRAHGARIRYDVHGVPHELSAPDIFAAVVRVAGTGAAWTMLRTDDAYHYGFGHEQATLPVVRARSAQGDYYYLDPLSAELLDRADSGDRAYRWWFSALHRWDFTRALRTSLGRTVVMLPLLLGAVVLTCLGAFLGIRRLTPWRVRESR